MRNTITHLPAQVQADLNIITKNLLEKAKDAPERSRIRYLILHGCFTEDHWQQDTALNPKEDYRYSLLIIVSQNLPGILPVLQDAVEQLNTSGKVGFPVSIEADTRGRLNRRLMDGYLAYDRVQERGIQIYCSNPEHNLFSPPEQQDVKEHHAEAVKHFDHAFPLAKSFLSGARSFEKEDSNAAAFLLNIAARQAYAAFMAVHTLKYPNSHDVSELRKLAESIFSELATVWSGPKAQSCFGLLKSAFSDARFQTDYSITDEQLDLMFDHVEELQEQIDRVCRAKLKALKSGSLEKPELPTPDSKEEKLIKKLSRLIFDIEEPCYELEGLVDALRDMSYDGAEEHPGIHVMSRAFGERINIIKDSFTHLTNNLRKRHDWEKAANG